MSSTTVTLAEVANRFQLWRDKQNNKSSPIPSHLKDQARQLLQSYSTSQVAASLNISRSALYYIKKYTNRSFDCSNQQNSKTLDFIPVNLADQNRLHNNQPITTKSDGLNLTCEIIKPNGIKLIIYTADPISIINAFLCSN